MDTQGLERRLRSFVAQHLPALIETRCVLAASGGADSTATIALLLESGIVQRDAAVVGHFDHRSRGPEASRLDRNAVEALCARYGLTCRIASWGSPERGEAAARDARYAALARIALRDDAAAILTGHTADDQAETVVMRAMRGAGLHGLAGMATDAPCSGPSDLRIIRPMLTITRAETRAYCAVRGLAYHDDATNDDRALTRNRIRHEILPAMERRAPGIREALVALARTSRTAAHALDTAAAQLIPLEREGATVVLGRRALAAAPGELLPHGFRLAITRLLGDARDFERRHYDLMARAVSATTGAVLTLPRGLVVTVDADAIRLSRGSLAATVIDPQIESDLPFDGIAGEWSLRVVPAAEARIADGGIDIRLPDGAVVRARRPGDRVRTRAGGKKLGDWYTDQKIPRRAREAAPVIAYGQHVFWTPWLPLGELPHGRPWRIISRRNPA